MYPHERSLVKRMKDEPFVLIGVNSDAELAKLQPRLAEERITWRSFWNGPQGSLPSFRLSDYRGKVVVIDFWGDW